MTRMAKTQQEYAAAIADAAAALNEAVRQAAEESNLLVIMTVENMPGLYSARLLPKVTTSVAIPLVLHNLVEEPNT